MRKRTKYKLVSLLAIILSLLACELPALPGVSAPSPAPGIGTIIAGTAAAAQMQTLSAIPPTATPTITILPTSTFTTTPTSTATVFFKFSTHTYTPSPPPPESVGAGCVLISQEPANNSVFAPKIHFETYWTVKNTGTEAWLDTNADFRYQSGTDINKKDILDLPYSIGLGSEVTLQVSMKTPEKPGTYTTNWVLVSGKTTLCKLYLRIIVK